MTSLMVLLLAACGLVVLGHVSAHGRLELPPGRSTAWRYGFNTPINYQDNELFCGGFWHQWGVNGGKCGVCGDPYEGPRENEAGGKYATGTIVASYSSGDVIDVRVLITANHLGYIEFRVCANNNIRKAASQDCFDQNLLAEAGSHVTRFPILASTRAVDLKLQLPTGLTCSQCVLQWKYNAVIAASVDGGLDRGPADVGSTRIVIWSAGNNWGTDAITGQSGLGFGPQEQFYGCADVAINDNGIDMTTKYEPVPTTTTTEGRTTTATTHRPTPTAPGTDAPASGCKAANAWEGQASMDAWCQVNCGMGYCPATHCVCS